MSRFQHRQGGGRQGSVYVNRLILSLLSVSLIVGLAPLRLRAAENPYSTDVFVRGTMNAWGTAHPMTFQDGVLTTVLMLDAKSYEFKVASADWAAVDFGADSDGPEIVLDAVKVFARKGANVKLTLAEAGLYRFTVDAADPEQPHVIVQKADAIAVTLHYRRMAGDYEGWGVYLRNQDLPALAAEELDGLTRDAPRAFDGEDEFGKYLTVRVINPAAAFGVMFHNGAETDHNGAELSLTVAQDGVEVWIVQGSDQKFSNAADAVRASLGLPDLYVRGSMNGWNATNKMAAKGTQFTAILALDAGPLEFKIAGADWAQADFGGSDDSAITLETPEVLTIKGGNLKLDVPEAGMYQFMLDAANPNAPALTVQPSQVALIHYQRKNKDYGGWGLHLWNFDPPALAQGVIDGITWDKPRPFDGEDEFGPYAFLELVDPHAQFGFIIHKGNDKDHGGLDMTLNPTQEGFEIWMVQGSQEKFTNKADALVAAGAVGNMREAAARWISRDTIVWPVDPAKGAPYLYYDPDGALTLDNGAITVGANGLEIPLQFAGAVGSGTVNDQKLAYLPSLRDWPRIATSELTDIRTLVTGALALALKNPEGQLVDATSLQLAGVLDDLFAYDGDLGVSFEGDAPTLRVWAPTAQSVRVTLLDSPHDASGAPVVMTRDPQTGVWSATGDASWQNQYYLYVVKVFTFWTGKIEQHLVTDPYSVSLSMNSARSQIVDLRDPALKPKGWDAVQKPALNALEDTVLYELHVRDFSVWDDTVPEELRGKFKAFTVSGSNGMTHLKALADAGLTHLHLLPVFDIATIDEDPQRRIEITNLIDDLCAKPGAAEALGDLCAANAGKTIRQVMAAAVADDPASEIPQKIAAVMRAWDGFNWGYDPFHYGVPEGSYATNPDGASRILEFRDMVKSLSDNGLRLVMDVVYNHTNAARDSAKSVLDKIVPGYYYRLDNRGNIQNTTCCPDMATEHRMMEKLMLDTLKRWAVEYKVDGFRFDLMGHHTRRNMQNARAMLDGLTLDRDGVDGAKIYIYGEGWTFGSIQANLPSTADPNDLLEDAAFTQTNSAGAGIGTFNDRIRDMVRGGGFGKPACAQGFVSGLEIDPNQDAACGISDPVYTLLNYADNIRVGLAGNLKDYRFTGHQGAIIRGQEVAYFGSAPAGYTAAPREVINYAEAHDNKTLWDYIQLQAPYNVAGRTPPTATVDERVRMQNLAISIIGLGQGIPFFHAGMDMLRSKCGDEDSYDYGDWFNRLDFTYASNNWGQGLPNADKNADLWPTLQPRLRDASLTPRKADILKAVQHFREVLQIRQSSPLFRLHTAADIQQRVRFLNAERGVEQLPGVIVMHIADTVGAELDPARTAILVAINVTPQAVTFSHTDLIGAALELHPVQQNSADDVVKQTTFDATTGSVTIPARTAAVLQEIQ